MRFEVEKRLSTDSESLQYIYTLYLVLHQHEVPVGVASSRRSVTMGVFTRERELEAEILSLIASLGAEYKMISHCVIDT